MGFLFRSFRNILPELKKCWPEKRLSLHNLLVTSFGKPYLSDLFGDLVTVSQSHDTQLLQRLHIPLVSLLLNPGDLKSPGKSRCQYPIRRRHQRWLLSPPPGGQLLILRRGIPLPKWKKSPVYVILESCYLTRDLLFDCSLSVLLDPSFFTWAFLFYWNLYWSLSVFWSLVLMKPLCFLEPCYFTEAFLFHWSLAVSLEPCCFAAALLFY